MSTEKRIKQRKRRRKKEILRFMKGTREKPKSEKDHVSPPSDSFFYFIFSKQAKNDLKSSVQISTVCFCPIPLQRELQMLRSTQVWSQHISRILQKLSESSFAAAVKETMCILVTLPTRNHVIHSLLVLHALTLVSGPVHQKSRSAGATGLCSEANIYTGVIDSVCFQHEQQECI